MVKIDDYSFMLGGDVCDDKDIFEVALHHIMEYENAAPSDQQYTVSSDMVNDGNNWYMTIKTSLGSYVVDNIEEHEPNTADNYITFSLNNNFTFLK